MVTIPQRQVLSPLPQPVRRPQLLRAARSSHGDDRYHICYGYQGYDSGNSNHGFDRHKHDRRRDNASGLLSVSVNYWNSFSGADGTQMQKMVDAFNEQTPMLR